MFSKKKEKNDQKKKKNPETALQYKILLQKKLN